jgi:hypothetical protein
MQRVTITIDDGLGGGRGGGVGGGGQDKRS